MKRIAIPISKGKLSEYFGQCNHYQIFEVSNGIINSEQLEVPQVDDLLKLPEWAASQGITDVITYKVDNKIISLFAEYKINIYVGVSINNTQTIIEEYLQGSLKSDEKILSDIIRK